jgi:hypothetical protein
MTTWNQIRTNKHWYNDTSDPNGEGGVGTAVYNVANESWALEAGMTHKFIERNGWVDGYRPKQIRISFINGSAVRVGVYLKGGGIAFTNSLLANSEPANLELIGELTDDIWRILIESYKDETPTVTNIAFSEEAYITPTTEQETWSNVNWSGENWGLHLFSQGETDEKVWSVLMDVASGVPYFVVTTGYDYAYGFPSVYANYGVKYKNGLWDCISKNEIAAKFYGENWDKFISTSRGFPANGMTVMNNGVVNVYYSDVGETSYLDVYQNYNVEGPPINPDTTSDGLEYGWINWRNYSDTRQGTYSSIMHTNMGKIIIPFTADSKSQIWYMQHYWNDPFTGNWTGGGLGSYDKIHLMNLDM